jgi:PAS domain S-box-containing protein
LASIVESCDDAILTIDLDGAITNWNKGAERLNGGFLKSILPNKSSASRKATKDGPVV